MSNELQLPTSTPQEREELARKEAINKLRVTPFNVLNIVYELLGNWMSANSPVEEGYPFQHKYNIDPTKSDIFMDISYNWKTQATGKVPAIFIQRGNVELKSPTMQQAVNHRPKESIDERVVFNEFTVTINCIATNVGFAEEFADYVKQPLLLYRQEIQQAFKLRKFALKGVSAPSIYLESKDNFIVSLSIDVAYDENWIIQRDDLKIKTIGRVIFDGITNRPLTNQ